MARIRTMDRDLAMAAEGLSPKALDRALAAFARNALAEAIARGEASPDHDRYVNGRAGAPEESVRAPGPIVYVFRW